ncbi:AGBL2 isoform 9 [Pongo abelii]|uniref:AGBL2 isoform 9 n=1 Tax=Pongo abelii TaxID=9601 RepID=A0A2J8WEN2_PONAB|nr:AGBL2 isoform 9 [Pongo abelii]
MFPALETHLKQTIPDPYEDFMYRHLQYYGYFKGSRSVTQAGGQWPPHPRLKQPSQPSAIIF